MENGLGIEQILTALRIAQGDIASAAVALRVSEADLRAAMAQYGIRAGDYDQHPFKWTARVGERRHRATRPNKALLERLIRETGGSVTEIARRLNVGSRMTVYKWIYQYGLDQLAGIGTWSRVDTVDTYDSGQHERIGKVATFVHPGGKKPATVEPMSSQVSPSPGSKSYTTVRLSESAWLAARKLALDRKCTASDVMNAALIEYLTKHGLLAEPETKPKPGKAHK